MKKETLTSRERVIRTLNRKPVDRFPIDLGIMYASGINAFAYHDLREWLGLSTDDIELTTLNWFLGRVDNDVLERFHCDSILLAPSWEPLKTWKVNGKYSFRIPTQVDTEEAKNGDWIFRAEEGEAKLPYQGQEFYRIAGTKSSHYFEGCIGERHLERNAARAKTIFEETEFATFYQIFGAYSSMLPDWLCEFMLSPEKIVEKNEAQLEKDILHAGRVIDSMGEHIQGVVMGADLGTELAPLVRPSLYEQYIVPTFKKFCSFIHRNSDLKVFFHCCGAIRPMIPMIIDCGVDILNPVQISASDMEPAELKQEFGDRIIFWGGGCDTQNVLGTATPEEVSAHVKEMVSIFKPGGGFVFNQVQDIMANVPPDNIAAMLDTAYEESFY